MPLNARSLIVVSVASACWAFGFGLGAQVISHWLKAQEISDTVIGLSHSFYYFGLAVASCLAPSMARRLGPAGCAALGMIVSGITLSAFSIATDEWAWYALRFLNGWGGAMSLVPLETIVSRDSAPDRKTLNFGIYGVSLTLGGAFGIALAPHLYPEYRLAFHCGAIMPLIAGCIVWLTLANWRGTPSSDAAPMPLGFGRNFLSYGTAWSQGFLEGGMLAFLVLFLESRGYSTDVAGGLFGVTMIGVILFQVPASWLGDRYGNLPILLFCYAVVIAGLATLPWLGAGFWLGVTLFVFGACAGAMYPLGLSLLSDRMPEHGLARAYAWYLAIECMGSQVGAAAAGKARDEWGPGSMFAVGLIAVVGVLIGWFTLCIIRKIRHVGTGNACHLCTHDVAPIPEICLSRESRHA